METKYVRVPFEVELAKKITNGECDGRIVTRDGRNARIVCWDRKSSSVYNIVALLYETEIELIFTYAVNGCEVVDRESDNDLMLEIPEYMTFKDGDVIAYDDAKDVFFIIGSKCSMTDENPHYHVKYEKGCITFGTEDSFCRLKGSRLATEEERYKIIEALKTSKNPKARKCLKILGIEVKQEFEFKPFDKVLGRGCETDRWRADLFSHMNETGEFICIGYVWEECIPYNEQTAHLLGTTENYE